MKQRVSVVILDLDNTLWDWVEIWGKSFGAMLRRVAADSGIPETTLKAEFKAVHERHGTSEYAFSLEELPSLRARHPEGGIPTIYKTAIDEFRDARRRHLRLFPGVLETLETLKERGCLLVGYTESLAFYSATRLRQLGLDRLLDFLYSPADHDLPDNLTPEQLRRYPAEHYTLATTVHRHTPAGELKPNPDILNKIITEVGAPKDLTIYVGDSEMKDVAMAQSAGVTDVWAKYGVNNTSPEYALLREVSHWPQTDIEREDHYIARRAKGGSPSRYALESGFSELLARFDFVPLRSDEVARVEDVIEIWKKVVDVQQHFNDIELRIRNFAITLFAAVISAAAFCVREGLELHVGPWTVPVASCIALAGALAWFLFYMMDQHWYHVFLRAAVDHAKVIEARWGSSHPEMRLSTAISERSGFPFPFRRSPDRTATSRLRFFYAVGSAILLATAGVAMFAHSSTRHQPAAMPATVEITIPQPVRIITEPAEPANPVATTPATRPSPQGPQIRR